MSESLKRMLEKRLERQSKELENTKAELAGVNALIEHQRANSPQKDAFQPKK